MFGDFLFAMSTFRKMCSRGLVAMALNSLTSLKVWLVPRSSSRTCAGQKILPHVGFWGPQHQGDAGWWGVPLYDGMSYFIPPPLSRIGNGEARDRWGPRTRAGA